MNEGQVQERGHRRGPAGGPAMPASLSLVAKSQGPVFGGGFSACLCDDNYFVPLLRGFI